MSYTPKNLVYRYTVGNGAEFTTVKEAVDWFNANGIGDSEVLIDGGYHSISSTIHIHNVSGYNLGIRGLDSGVTYLEAASGLEGTPMFDVVTPCDFRMMTCEGSTLAGYGVTAGEDCFSFATTTDLYSEISDIIINNFMVGVHDTIGSDLFVFNFVLDTCQTGVAVNYTTNSPTSPKPMLDMEIGNLIHCPIGVNLIKTGAAKKGNFFLNTLIFKHNSVSDIGIKYDGVNYIYGELANVFKCTYNNTGTLGTGFDFTNVRDANIQLIGNIGIEDSKPHAKIGVYNSAVGVVITSPNVFYKAAFTNTSSYTTKMTITNNKMLYQSIRKMDGMMWVSGAITVNQNNRNLEVCVRNNVPITSLIGGVAVATIVTPNKHGMSTGSQVQILGCTSATYNGVKTVTVIDDYTFTYPNTTNAGNVTGATTCGNLMGITSVRVTTSGQSYPFSLGCYVEDMVQNGYSEVYVTSTNGGDTVTVTDLSWLFNTV